MLICIQCINIYSKLIKQSDLDNGLADLDSVLPIQSSQDGIWSKTILFSILWRSEKFNNGELLKVKLAQFPYKTELSRKSSWRNKCFLDNVIHQYHYYYLRLWRAKHFRENCVSFGIFWLFKSCKIKRSQFGSTK